MYVCICNDVKDKQVKKAIALGYETMSELKEHLDIATCCGCCEPMVQDYLDDHHANNTSLNSLVISI